MPAPDVVAERYLEVRACEYGYAVTVIELLSPDNKRPGTGATSNINAKHETLLTTRTSLVEIDLLRARGRRLPSVARPPESNYRIVMVAAGSKPRTSLSPFDVRDPIPAVPIPLRRGDDEPLFDLNALLHSLYDQAVYNLRIDYTPVTHSASSAGGRMGSKR